MATKKKRTSSASTSRSNSYANLQRRFDEQVKATQNVQQQFSQVCNERDSIADEMHLRRKADAARPFRDVAITVRDKTGRVMWNQTLQLNLGDDASFSIGSDGPLVSINNKMSGR